jgi:GntR family transcriptional regulator
MRAPSVPLYVQIQNFIRGGIANGRFRDGDRLPSEPELAQRFATTRSTVAKALQQLAFEGVISRRIGSGTYVGDGRREDRVDTTEFASYEQHVLAGGERLEYELLSFKPKDVSDEVKQRLGLTAGAAVYQLERLRLVEGAPTAIEVRFLPSSIAERIDEEQLRSLTVQDILREHLGLRIARIDNAVSAAIATERFAKLLNVRRGDPLLVREHTIFAAQNRPLLYGKAIYGGDFKIHYSLHSTDAP